MPPQLATLAEVFDHHSDEENVDQPEGHDGNHGSKDQVQIGVSEVWLPVNAKDNLARTELVDLLLASRNMPSAESQNVTVLNLILVHDHYAHTLEALRKKLVKIFT
jgi:hypothetical protein